MKMMTYLGRINASIQIPSDFVVSSNRSMNISNPGSSPEESKTQPGTGKQVNFFP